EVQMGPGRKAGRADVADDLPHMNGTALLHFGTDLRQVTIDADHLMLMLDADAVAELATPSGADYRSVCDALNRLAVFRDQVNADVRAVLVQDRMIAMERKAGRYVLEIQRELQRLRTERVALFVI